MSQKNFTVENYMAIASEIDTHLFETLFEDMHSQLPEDHVNSATAIYITIRLMTKVICSACGDNKESRLKAVAEVHQKL